MAKCQTLLRNAVKIQKVLVSSKPMFKMNCLSHVIAGVCTASVLTSMTEYSEINTKQTRQRIQNCITWTKPPQQGAVALATVQGQFKLSKLRQMNP